MTRQVVAIVATLDTKGEEVAYLRDLLIQRGATPWLVDTGVLGLPSLVADVTRDRVAELGGDNLDSLRAAGDPASALRVMATGAGRALAARPGLAAVVGVTGGKGAGLFASATEELPLSLLRVLVSSARAEVLARLASTSPTVVVPTLVDLMGLNRFTRQALHRAAVLAADRQAPTETGHTACTVAVTAFGVTTPAAMACVHGLRQRGFDTIVFPANGSGGRLLERLVGEGTINGLLDLTTTELADEVVGGTAGAGSDRMRGAGRAGIPHWVAPGAVDMVNFGPPEEIPAAFAGRKLYRHSDYTTLLRTSADECYEIGRVTAQRLSAGRGPRHVCWPAGGFSDYDRPGRPFHDPAADRAWLDGLRNALSGDITVSETDCHINDPAVAARAVDWMASRLSPARVLEHR